MRKSSDKTNTDEKFFENIVKIQSFGRITYAGTNAFPMQYSAVATSTNGDKKTVMLPGITKDGREYDFASVLKRIGFAYFRTKDGGVFINPKTVDIKKCAAGSACFNPKDEMTVISFNNGTQLSVFGNSKAVRKSLSLAEVSTNALRATLRASKVPTPITPVATTSRHHRMPAV